VSSHDQDRGDLPPRGGFGWRYGEPGWVGVGRSFRNANPSPMIVAPTISLLICYRPRDGFDQPPADPAIRVIRHGISRSTFGGSVGR